MDKKQTTDKRLSWFWRWFLNNQVVTALLIVLLVLLIILTFTKVSYLSPSGSFSALSAYQ